MISDAQKPSHSSRDHDNEILGERGRNLQRRSSGKERRFYRDVEDFLSEETYSKYHPNAPTPPSHPLNHQHFVHSQQVYENVRREEERIRNLPAIPTDYAIGTYNGAGSSSKWLKFKMLLAETINCFLEETQINSNVSHLRIAPTIVRKEKGLERKTGGARKMARNFHIKALLRQEQPSLVSAQDEKRAKKAAEKAAGRERHAQKTAARKQERAKKKAAAATRKQDKVYKKSLSGSFKSLLSDENPVKKATSKVSKLFKSKKSTHSADSSTVGVPSRRSSILRSLFDIEETPTEANEKRSKLSPASMEMTEERQEVSKTPTETNERQSGSGKASLGTMEKQETKSSPKKRIPGHFYLFPNVVQDISVKTCLGKDVQDEDCESSMKGRQSVEPSEELLDLPPVQPKTPVAVSKSKKDYKNKPLPKLPPVAEEDEIVSSLQSNEFHYPVSFEDQSKPHKRLPRSQSCSKIETEHRPKSKKQVKAGNSASEPDAKRHESKHFFHGHDELMRSIAAMQNQLASMQHKVKDHESSQLNMEINMMDIESSKLKMEKHMMDLEASKQNLEKKNVELDMENEELDMKNEVLDLRISKLDMECRLLRRSRTRLIQQSVSNYEEHSQLKTTNQKLTDLVRSLSQELQHGREREARYVHALEHAAHRTILSMVRNSAEQDIIANLPRLETVQEVNEAIDRLGGTEMKDNANFQRFRRSFNSLKRDSLRIMENLDFEPTPGRESMMSYKTESEFATSLEAETASTRGSLSEESQDSVAARYQISSDMESSSECGDETGYAGSEGSEETERRVMREFRFPAEQGESGAEVD